MNDGYVKTDPWRLVEDRFDPSRALSSESLFALGNGVMGGRANFEERYSGETLQGNYIGGVYYPDKTRVGWWKNGYPEYFAKVPNAAFWIGVDVAVDGEPLDLATVEVKSFRREMEQLDTERCPADLHDAPLGADAPHEGRAEKRRRGGRRDGSFPLAGAP